MPTGPRKARPDDRLRIETGISIDFYSIEISDHSASRTVRNDHANTVPNDGNYRTSSFIAASRPSIVIGNMRSENIRRMMVVDSE
jgi:hypothetical protein